MTYLFKKLFQAASG